MIKISSRSDPKDEMIKYIVSINMFGNGLSSSPSNTESPQDGPRFPHVSLWDNVACQYRLLTEALGVKRIALVTGWSMAGCQAYQWAAQYPDFVDAILPFCASAKTSPHNFVFLEGVRSALCADQHWNNGDYSSPPVNGLKAFARVKNIRIWIHGDPCVLFNSVTFPCQSKATVRPRDTRPQAARTSTVHDFELGPKNLEKHVFLYFSL